MKIGVLALQGAVREHMKAIQEVGAEAVEVKDASTLQHIDALILPGGESTTMRRLMDYYGLLQPLRTFATTGKPMFGTCAGLILLAQEIEGYEKHIGCMDVKVKRNSFGRQIDSFQVPIDIKGMDEPFPAVFIRAPHIVSAGKDVEVLAEVDGRIVLARDRQFLGCSFHPELTNDFRIMKYFKKMVASYLENLQKA